MSKLDEYQQNLMADIRREADASGIFPVEAFFDRMTERLTLTETVRTTRREERARQTLTEGINAQTEVVKLGADFWRRALEWGLAQRSLTGEEQRVFQLCASIPRRLPDDRESRRALETLALLRGRGFGEA